MRKFLSENVISIYSDSLFYNLRKFLLCMTNFPFDRNMNLSYS